jgi:hypothetical protein
MPRSSFAPSTALRAGLGRGFDVHPSQTSFEQDATNKKRAGMGRLFSLGIAIYFEQESLTIFTSVTFR